MSKFKQRLYKVYSDRIGGSKLESHLKGIGLNPYKLVDANKYDENVMKYKKKSDIGQRYISDVKKDFKSQVDRTIIEKVFNKSTKGMSDEDLENKISPVKQKYIQKLKKQKPVKPTYGLG